MAKIILSLRELMHQKFKTSTSVSRFLLLLLTSSNVFPPHISPLLCTFPYVPPPPVSLTTTSSHHFVDRHCNINITPNLQQSTTSSRCANPSFCLHLPSCTVAAPPLTAPPPMGQQIQICSRGSEEGTSVSAPRWGNTSFHGLCQFGSIQSLSFYLFTLDVCNCFPSVEQELCGLPSPMLPFFI